jgi:hypothetical protein
MNIGDFAGFPVASQRLPIQYSKNSHRCREIGGLGNGPVFYPILYPDDDAKTVALDRAKENEAKRKLLRKGADFGGTTSRV